MLKVSILCVREIGSILSADSFTVPPLPSPPLPLFLSLSSFFGGHFNFFGGNGGGDGHHEIPRGGTINLDCDVSLEDLYVGNFIELARHKAVPKPSAGTRQCNCRTEMKTFQTGPGRFQVRRLLYVCCLVPVTKYCESACLHVTPIPLATFSLCIFDL